MTQRRIKQYKYINGGGEYMGYYDDDIQRKISKCNCILSSIIGYSLKIYGYTLHYSFFDKNNWINNIVNNNQIIKTEFYL